MPDYKSIHTGTQIDSGVTKGLRIPDPTAADAGKSLVVNSSGTGFSLEKPAVEYTKKITFFSGNATVVEIPMIK